jgi:hypothetical protein
VPEFHRQAASDATERREQAREQLAASDVMLAELDAVLANSEGVSVS